MTDAPGRLRGALHAAIDAALEAAEADLGAQLDADARDNGRALTAWQGYANELHALCERVLQEADETTAGAYWEFLIEVAARHAVRAHHGGWR